MSQLRQKNKIRLETKQGFGNVLDIFHHIAFLQVMFCFLVTVYFNMYQNAKASFQPMCYMSIGIFLAFIIAIESLIVENGKLLIAEIVAGIIYFVIIPIEGPKMWIGLVILVLIVDSIWKHQFRFSEAASYAQRYRTSRRIIVFGVMLVVLFFAHIFSSVEAFPGLDVSNYYMLASFAIYVIAVIMSRYTFSFYDYQRQNVKEDENTQKNMNYSFKIFFLFLIVLIAVLVVVFAGALEPIFTFLKNKGLKYLLSALLFILTHFGSTKQGKFDLTQSDPALDFITTNKVQELDDPLSKAVPTLVILILLAAVIYGLWRLYKSILANSKIGKDETEFIDIKKENRTYIEPVSSYKKNVYGKSNKEKIRKYYFNTMEKRRRKFKVSLKPSNTPKEIEIKLRAGERDKMEKITQLYEKARYSHHNCSDDEVEQTKKLSEQL